MSRIKNSIRNIKYAVVGQFSALLISLASRMVFVHILNAEYLGINGLFTNILSILSLAELGIGSAIIYSMYKPLSEKDEIKLTALMGLYRKAYITIGVAVAAAGAALTPSLEYFVKEMPDVPYLQLIYLMFVANSSISYFFSYKRSLIIADQKRYIATLYRYSFYFLLNAAQIVILLLTKNYILYLGLQIICTFAENICVSIKADRLYPFLKGKNNACLNENDKKAIIRNVKAMLFHRIGSIIVMGTDNLLISKYVGVVAVGLYSNYLLIINALNSVFGLGFESITASIGNLGVTETNDKKIFIFKCMDLAVFWAFGFASICLINLFNPFIKLWLGDYIFPAPVVLLIVLNFYLTGRRKSVLTFRDAFGLFWYDRYKPLFEAGINLIASVIMAKKIGIAGVFIGTTISTLTTCFWVEPFVLYKYGFKSPVRTYFIKYVIWTVFAFAAGIITSLICSVFANNTLVDFLAKMTVCIIVPNILFAAAFWKTEEFQYLSAVFKNILNRRGNLQARVQEVHTPADVSKSKFKYMWDKCLK